MRGWPCDWDSIPGAQKRGGNGAAGKKGLLTSLRFRFRLRRSHDQRLVVLERAFAEILRARQRLPCEFGLAELAIGQVQLIMHIAVMIQRGRLLEFRHRTSKLS